MDGAAVEERPFKCRGNSSNLASRLCPKGFIHSETQTTAAKPPHHSEVSDA